MIYFNGFALRDDSRYFSNFLDDRAYVISGFSYGAIKAFEAALAATTRVDKLQLISPAFFQEKSEKFKRLQMIGYQKDSGAYVARFTENCFLPYKPEPLTYGEHNTRQLEELLHFEWSEEALRSLQDRGTAIEVFLGEEDRISDAGAAYTFFSAFATVTLIKGANHFLQGENR